jgi:uncharacterized protein (DUF1800 family)
MATKSLKRKQISRILFRTQFGGQPNEINTWLARPVSSLLTKTFKSINTVQTSVPPEYQDLDPKDNRGNREQVFALQYWILDQMTTSTTPIVEKLMWLWHDTWATSATKINNAKLMGEQNRKFRVNAAGSYRTLSRVLLEDSALQLWLDNQQNNKKSPNENLSRELMELFILGDGNFSESDVKEGAKVLTGFRRIPSENRVAFYPAQQSPGPHTILGKTANFSPTDLTEILVSQGANADFLVQKLSETFLGDLKISTKTANVMKKAMGNDREVAKGLEVLIKSKDFLESNSAYVRSPVEWLVATAKLLGFVPSDLAAKVNIVKRLSDMGQVPLEPPNVGGWPDLTSWLSTGVTRNRMDLARELVRFSDINWFSSATDRTTEFLNRAGLYSLSTRTISAMKLASTPSESLIAGLVSPEFIVGE